MKNLRKLIPAIAMLMVSVILLSTASFAWFSMNKSVTATGLEITAKGEGSLVISHEPTVANLVTYGFADATNALTPIKYDESTKGYQYCANTQDVDPATGIALNGKTLSFAAVSNGSGYYVDYVIYLASSGTEMTNQTLSATVTFDSPQKEQRAISVAFYTTTTRTTTAYTVAASGVERNAVATALDNNGTAVSIITGLTIPVNTTTGTGGSIPVLMRVYIDGAMLDTATTENTTDTVVRSADVLLSELEFTVTFSVA